MSARFRRRIRRAHLTLLALVALALAVPVREASGQGTIIFNMRVSGAAVNQTGHIWGPSTNNPLLALIGLGSNDNPSGTAPFGSGYWGAASSNLGYAGGAGSGQRFILLQSADPTAPLSAWTRVATNTSTPGSFPVPPVGTAAPKYYRVKRE